DVFDEQRQELSTSYYVVDVRWRCDGTDEIRELFVAGVLEDGNSVIERWKFTYSLAFGPNGQPVPLSLRRPPRVNRTQLYSGSSLGRVLTVEPDPDGRFVLFLTRNPAALYRIDLPGGTPALVIDSSTVPAIANAGIVHVCQHISEGRQYHLSSGHRWEYDASLPSDVIFLRDGNNDAVFDPPVVVTQAQWTQAGYDVGSAWVSLCQ
ncbi:MAG TPA: hypothetical protein PLV92_23985, partial [Pirellulaceae bacterium]|nr:hypothetical protein [Pirellulaceae bacterium]